MVGVRNDAEEFAQRGPGGDYSGFDVEIARDLAERMGLGPQQVQFRRLPPSLLTNAVTSGNVDLLLGGSADSSALAEAGPYAVAGEPRFAVVTADDAALVAELERMFDESVADGTWQRIYDGTLAGRGIEVRPR
nr:transporter substrate-binding domain-containing protein [Saccharopolyspora sp. HNM0983]